MRLRSLRSTTDPKDHQCCKSYVPSGFARAHIFDPTSTEFITPPPQPALFSCAEFDTGRWTVGTAGRDTRIQESSPWEPICAALCVDGGRAATRRVFG